MRWLMILLMFLFFGAFFIINNNNLHLNEKNQQDKFWHEYYNWASELFDNGKSVVGYVINSNWIPANEKNVINNTNISK